MNYPSSHRVRARRTGIYLLLVAALLLALCGCGGGERDLFAYQGRDMHVQVRGVRQGCDFAGELHYLAPSAGAGEATVTLTLSTPTAWQGITLTLTGDHATMALGELRCELPGGTRGTWFDIPALFTARGTVTEIVADGQGTTRVTFADADGSRITVTLDSASGAPRRIEAACGWVEIEA